MPKPTFYVAPGNSLSINGRLFAAGAVIPFEVLDGLKSKQREKLFLSNLVLTHEEIREAAEDKKPDGSSTTTRTAPGTPAKPPQGNHKFAFDPAELEALSLEQLNIKLIELSPDAKPFADKAEAVGFLSQDFGAA